MKSINRRMFLVRGSMAAAAAGVATALPLSPLLTDPDAEAPAQASAAGGEGAAAMTEPLVAHVRDLPTGEIGVYSGDREIIFHDTGLANRLFNASR
jgi:hypothetical protein